MLACEHVVLHFPSAPTESCQADSQPFGWGHATGRGIASRTVRLLLLSHVHGRFLETIENGNERRLACVIDSPTALSRSNGDWTLNFNQPKRTIAA